ncbi:alpha/beta fold hydrolase [Acidisphaera sp. L21]|uniref:alpha/beta fold hydrolase n=1 Tax=Acidisphaera sp. L21 TaxID=1641851 RepID=UPI00131B4E75|nr:alpha/beta hydrolase [Acidisphaera sp. L21]
MERLQTGSLIPDRVRHVETPDGITLAVQEWGDPAGPEVLLIHGVGQSHLCFDRQFNDARLRRCHLVSYDVRGHGGSAKPTDPRLYHDPARWAEEVQAVMDVTGLHRPLLLGWSLGGRIITQYLLTKGDAQIAGVNFVSARAIADPAFSGPGMRDLPQARAHDIGSLIHANSAFLRACFYRQMSESEFTVALAYNMIVPPAVRAAIRDWPPDLDRTRAALRRVTIPVLVTHGLQDSVVLPASGQHTASLIPHAQVSWFEDCGHSPFFENAERFNQEFLTFVEDNWRPGR